MRDDEQFAREYRRLERLVIECVGRAGPFAHTSLDPASLAVWDDLGKRAIAALIALFWASEDPAPDPPVSRLLAMKMEMHGR